MVMAHNDENGFRLAEDFYIDFPEKHPRPSDSVWKVAIVQPTASVTRRSERMEDMTLTALWWAVILSGLYTA